MKTETQKIIELCEMQLLIMKTAEKAPCMDEFVSLMKMIKRWAEQSQRKEQA